MRLYSQDERHGLWDILHIYQLVHGYSVTRSNSTMRRPLHLSHFEGHWIHLTWGWTESSISLELTKTGASGEKLERYGSSVSHGVHASRETRQSRQGSTSHLSLLLSLVPIWINSVRFVFLPSSIIKLHTHLPPSCTWSCLAVKFWIGYALRCLNFATPLSDLGKYLFLQLLFPL